eukprot:Gb_32947 [translate_table: standard]
MPTPASKNDINNTSDQNCTASQFLFPPVFKNVASLFAASSYMFATFAIVSSSTPSAIAKYKWPNGLLEGGRKVRSKKGRLHAMALILPGQERVGQRKGRRGVYRDGEGRTSSAPTGIFLAMLDFRGKISCVEDMGKKLGPRSNILMILVISLMIVHIPSCSGGGHPFAAKASLIRYWRRVLPKVRLPPFLLEKASPLNPTSVARFSLYIQNHSLADHIASFCRAADLLCSRRMVGETTEKITGDSDFQSYNSKNFSSYKVGGNGGGDTFKNYSDGDNLANDDFKRYGKDSNFPSEVFANYAPDAILEDEGFANYGGGSSAGSADFSTYGPISNIPNHHFKNYGDERNGNSQSFKSYADKSNGIKNAFASYGKEANAISNDFTSYAKSSNVITNEFKGYSENGNGASEHFTSYAEDGNVATNDFQNYAANGNGVSQTFRTYSLNTTFKEYQKEGPTFSDYSNTTNCTAARLGLEAGKFFRQKLLVQGSNLPLPNLRDPMPRRAFLPRSLADAFPFNSTELLQLMRTFRIPENSSMESIMANTLKECERAPVKGEVKRCVTSIEAMAEFAVSILGPKVEVLTTWSTGGSGHTVQIGQVNAKDGGRVTRSVSCHQSVFPYMVYYCHSVPLVKVYEAALMDASQKKKVNDGVAICHLDTSQWSAKHAAFLSLGSKPGKIEVCHWIFENDLIWVPSHI